MTAEYETFHTIGGDTERVLTGVRGSVVYAPDLRPSDAPGAAAPMETGPGHQLAQLQEPETLAKVLPAGGPLLPGHPADKTPVWRCEGCGLLSTTERRPTCLQSRTFGCPMVKS